MLGAGLFVVWLIGGAICGVLAAGIADARGASGCGAGLLGFVLGPIALAVAFLMPPDKARVEAYHLKRGDLRRCPFCREAIRHDATMCPHCRTTSPALPPRKGFFEGLLG